MYASVVVLRSMDGRRNSAALIAATKDPVQIAAKYSQ
jgi:hypothetical protein